MNESITKEYFTLAEVVYLTGENAAFYPTGGGLIAFEMGDKKYDRVMLHRCFPFSAPDEYISVRNADGDEVGMIVSLDSFSEEVAALLQAQMALRYYAPVIERVNRIRDEFGYLFWDVQTDCGPMSLTCRSGQGSIVRVTPTHLVVTDVDGNRYDLPDTQKLTIKEMARLEVFL